MTATEALQWPALLVDFEPDLVECWSEEVRFEGAKCGK